VLLSAAAFYSRDWFAGDVIMSTGVLYGLDLGVVGVKFLGVYGFTVLPRTFSKPRSFPLFPLHLSIISMRILFDLHNGNLALIMK
jgi:hypothetical protein